MASDKRKKASGMADGKNTDCGSISDTEPKRWRKRPVEITARRMERPFEVETMEGTMRGKAGDWLITGIRGEQYPCDDAIFRQTYEPAWNTESGSVALPVAWRFRHGAAWGVTEQPSVVRSWEAAGADITPLYEQPKTTECRSVFSGDDLRRILEWHEEVRSTCGISADDDNLRKRIVGALRTTEQESVTDRLRGLLRRMLAQGYHSAADMLEREIQAMDCGSVDDGGEG